MSIWNAGTVAAESGSTTIVGTGTGWAIAVVTGGNIIIHGLSYAIVEVTDDTHLEIFPAYLGADESGLAYFIDREASQAATALFVYDKLVTALTKLSLSAIQPDGAGTLAQRDALDPVPSTGYRYLLIDPGVSADMRLDVKTDSGWDRYELRGRPGVGEGGYGLPAGGTTGQVPKKVSGADGEVEWADESGSVLSVNGQDGTVVLDATHIATDAGGTFDGDPVEDVLDDHDARITDLESFGDLLAGNNTFTGENTFGNAGDDAVVAIDKDTAGDDAVLTLQTNGSGRAQLGTIGDDDFRIRVSPDGAAWEDALVVDKDTGIVSLGSGAVLPDGVKIANEGTASTSGLELEGGGIFGKVGLVIKSIAGLTGALFEQRSASPLIDLIDFGFKTLSHQLNIRVESRAAYSQTGSAPELQFFQQRMPANPDIQLFATSPLQAKSFVPFCLPSYTVAGLPGAATVMAGAMVYVSNASGGAVPAFSDGSSWRRVTDRVVVT